jgi:hypothetical protein
MVTAHRMAFVCLLAVCVLVNFSGEAMTTGRGREAKVRAEYRDLYRGIQATDWQPVEHILEQVTRLASEERGRDGSKARPLQDDHFEFRGSSPRPEGFPPRLSRASDADAEPRKVAALQEGLEQEQHQLTARQREADATIARAEQLRERVDALQQDFERLRQRAADLDLRTGPVPEADPSDE